MEKLSVNPLATNDQTSQVSRKIAVFGLSGNPPTGTNGHMGLIDYFSKLGYFSEIIILPVYYHPFSSKHNLEVFEHRYEMCKLNFASTSSNNCHVRVSDLEMELFGMWSPHGSHDSELVTMGTYDVLSHIRATHSHDEIHLILGMDTFTDLIMGKWKESEALLNEYHIEVIERKGVNTIELGPYTDKLNHTIHVHHIVSLQHISSTQVREALITIHDSHSQNILRNSLNKEVYEYIWKNHLYEIDRSDKSLQYLFQDIPHK